MTPVEVRQAIAARVGDALVAMPEVGLDLASNILFTAPPGASWVRLTILDGNERFVGIGGPTAPMRQPVLAYLDVFVPGDTGDGRALTITTALKDSFRRWQSGSLRCIAIAAGAEGRDAGGPKASYRKQTIITFTLSTRG